MSVKYVDHMGDDLRIVNAARVSFKKMHCEFERGDKRLLGFLLKHDHWTPFSHPQITLKFKMPIFVARQWYKHTIGLVRNEVSRRYVNSEPKLWTPDHVRGSNPDKKQGSMAYPCDNSPNLIEKIKEKHKKDIEFYNMMLESGACPEQARAELPQSMYTEFYETGSLWAYIRVISLRAKPDAQKETQEYADKVKLILKPLFPVTMKLIEDTKWLN